MVLEKYNANGNDFLISHRFKRDDFSEIAKIVCNRQSGIGADGLIILIPHKDYDFEWLFYNSDGSEAEMCGNGSRATAHYAFSNGLAPSEMSFLTGAGEIGCKVENYLVTTDLTPPKILNRNIEEFGKKWWLINTGVPHLVSLREEISNFSIEEARELRYKYNANVNIAKVEDGKLFVRTYERGVENETLACGTGMAACFYNAFLEGFLKSEADVFPKSGERLYLATKGETLIFRGEVQKTFFADFKV
jgi:diaminopimelate epimerase